MIIFIKLLILCSSVNCLELDSIEIKELFESFRNLSKNKTEINILHKLSNIYEEIIGFDYNFIKRQINDTKLDKEFKEKELINFITGNVLKILEMVDIKDIFGGIKNGVSTKISCNVCHIFLEFLLNPLIPINIVGKAIVKICDIIKIKNVPASTCAGYVKMFKKPFDYIRRNTHLKHREFCGILIGVHCLSISDKCLNKPIPSSQNLCWNLNITTKKTSNESELKPREGNIIRILHLSDIHIDRDYWPNFDPNCGQTYCCRKYLQNSTVIVNNPNAGFWGSYYCDPPLHSVQNLFQSIDWNSIDLVYWTGDTSDHMSWTDNWDDNIEDSRIISELFKNYSKSIVIGAIGNHLAIPIGTYAPPNIQDHLSSKPIYEELVKQWNQWLDTKNLKSFLEGGYYSLPFGSDLKIIVVNTNYCARLNIWTYYQSIDPSDHLKWLNTQLDEAERSKQFVHIVGHIPPDNRECTQAWLYNYLQIIERYGHIIVGQFFGHTHMDEFRLLHSNNNCNHPIGYEILSPSFTTQQIFEINPTYRIITTTEQGKIIDIETFSYDLSAANSKGYPEWTKEYSMANDYSIGFGVYEFSIFYLKLIKDINYMKLFKKHYTRSQPNNGLNETNILNDMKVCNPFHEIPKPISTVG